MIVTCPNCETRYNLPDEKIPAGGAKVKCSKCSQVFKAELPPETPEEEVEALLDEESQGGDTQAGDEFDETFEDMATGADDEGVEESVFDESEDQAADEPEDESFEESMDVSEDEAPAEEDDLGDDLFEDLGGDEEAEGEEPADDLGDDFPDTDDLFDESEEELPEPDEGATPSEPDDAGVGDDLFDDLGDEEDESAEAEDDLFGDDDADDDLFDEDEDEESGDDLFAEDEADDEESDEDDDTDPFGDDSGLSLEDEGKSSSSRKSLGCLIVIAVVALVLGAGIYFQVWTYMGINLGDMLKNVPFVGQMFMEETGGDEAAAPGESPAERVRKIELKNVKQYYVANEKAGNLFVVEGKAINKFAEPKERIKVEVILYDGTNNVLTSKAFLCGNVLSQFQLQVQSENEIKDGLASEVGILSNNTFIRPGASTPFMAVFFQPPAGVKEFMVKVVDVGDPE